MKVLVVTAGRWHFADIAAELQRRDMLAQLWMTDLNKGRVARGRFRHCWPHFLFTKPFHLVLRARTVEKLFWGLIPLWGAWARACRLPDADIVLARNFFALEVFERYRHRPVLKVLDCGNSHPAEQQAIWQRENAAWGRPPLTPMVVPRAAFRRMQRELQLADVVACPSHFVYESMRRHGVAPEKLAVNPYGVDIDRFPARPGVPPHPRFVCVGSISIRKGHAYLLRAFERVRAERPDADLVCVGGVEPDFEHEWNRWKDGVTHVPFAPQPVVAAELQRATAFVFPSTEEGLARVVLEAMAAGLPVIASPESGAPTVVDDGREGLIVDGRDPAALAGAMLELAADRDRNERMGRAARARVGERLLWRHHVDRLLALRTPGGAAAEEPEP